jgi:hypothetical protein
MVIFLLGLRAAERDEVVVVQRDAPGRQLRELVHGIDGIDPRARLGPIAALNPAMPVVSLPLRTLELKDQQHDNHADRRRCGKNAAPQ